MNFRKVKALEYDSLAKLHLLAFNDFFLSSLGNSFLKTYYKACLKSKESIAVCSMNENQEIIGFGIGCILSKGYHKRLILKNFLEFTLQIFQILSTNPKAIYRLANNLEKSFNKDDDGRYAELLSIAVLPESKGSGIGKKIMVHFEAEAKLKGCNKIALTTDYYNNDDVINFYKKRGYEVFYEFTAYPKRKMYKMIKILK